MSAAGDTAEAVIDGLFELFDRLESPAALRRRARRKRRKARRWRNREDRRRRRGAKPNRVHEAWRQATAATADARELDEDAREEEAHRERMKGK